MRKILLLLVIFYKILSFATAEQYLVENVKVDFTEKDSSTAREVSINYAEKMALNILFKNIEINPSNSILIKQNELQKAISSMQILNEKISNTSYSASLNIEFSQNYINFLLNKYRINKFSPRLNSYLIVPFFLENKEIYLFERNNISIRPFEARVKNTNNIFIVKNDHYTKTILKNINEDTKFYYNNFKGLFNYYNVNNIVFIFVKKNGDVFNNKFFVLNDTGVREAELNYKNIVYDGSTDKIIEYLKSLTTSNNEEKKENEIIEDDYIKLFVTISSLKDFYDVEKVLGYNNYITSKTLKSIDKNNVVYYLKISNDKKDFMESLKKDGFVVSEKKEGIYVFLQ